MALDVRPIFSALLRNRAALALVVVQIAITLAVICNSLFIVLDRAARVGRPSGMDEANTFTITSLGFVVNFDLRNTVREDLDAIRSLPGVRSATTVNTIPMSQNGWGTRVDVLPIDPAGTRRGESSAVYVVDEGGVAAFGATLAEGREFTAADIAEIGADSGVEAASIIVTRALAERLFPAESAVGKTVFGIANGGASVTVVGVVERLQQPWPTARAVESSTLVPGRFVDDAFSTYLVRTEPGQRDRLMKEVEVRLGEINPGRMLRELDSVQTVREESYRDDRAMITILLAVMAGMLLVTGAGIVGLASFWVTHRIKQIGTRRALGARRVDIRNQFRTENAIMVALGVLLGGVLTYGFNLWLMQQYQAPRLPWFYLPLGALCVFVLGQLAVLGPAARAAKVPPAVATRSA